MYVCVYMYVYVPSVCIIKTSRMQGSVQSMLPFVSENVIHTCMYIYIHVLFCHGCVILKLFKSLTHLRFISGLRFIPGQMAL